MTWEYIVPEGRHYHRGHWKSLLRSMLHPVGPWVKRIEVEVELGPEYWEKPERFQVPPQINKVYGFGVLGLPHWYSLRLGAACPPGRVDLFRYAYRAGERYQRREGRRSLPGPFRCTFDLARWRKECLPWYLRWLPLFRLHTYHGGSLPARAEMHTRVEEIKTFNS